VARTNSVAVAAILGRNYDEATDLSPFIETAYLMVNKVVLCAARKGATTTAEGLEIIERWLAAHYYGCHDQFYTSKSTGGASASFQGQTGMRLEATFYGQTALGLDDTGCLEALSKRNTASMVWLGKHRDERTDHEDRG
jgi:hypothetical protein